MVEFINIADLPDLNDEKGRSYRQVNADKKHKYKLGQLVELDNGCRAFIAKQTRDCDMTPLYILCFCRDDIHLLKENPYSTGFSYGHSELYLSEVSE